MDFVLLSEETGPLFREVLSAEALARLEEDTLLSIGAVEDGEVAGAAAVGIRRGVMELVSVSGRAEQLLLEELLFIADGCAALTQVRAEFPANPFFDDYARLLESFHFRKTAEYTVHQLPMAELVIHPLVLRSVKDPRIHPLADVPQSELRRLERSGKNLGTLPRPIRREEYLGRVSMAVYTSAGVEALVLFSPRRAGGCSLSGLWAKRPLLLPLTLSAALAAACRSYSTGGVFEFAARSPEELQLAKKLFPNARTDLYRVLTLEREKIS